MGHIYFYIFKKLSVGKIISKFEFITCLFFQMCYNIFSKRGGKTLEDKQFTFNVLLSEAENLYQKILNVQDLDKEEKIDFINEICNLTFNLQKLKEMQKEKENNFKLILFRNIINSILLTFITGLLFVFKYYLLFILGIILLGNRVYDYLIIKKYGINNYREEVNKITRVIDECTIELDKKERIIIQKVSDNVDLDKEEKIFDEKNIVNTINEIDNNEVYDIKNPEYEESKKLVLMK